MKKRYDDLVTQLAAKCGLEKAQAQRDTDALLKGRHNLTLTANGRAEATYSGGLGRSTGNGDGVMEGEKKWLY